VDSCQEKLFHERTVLGPRLSIYIAPLYLYGKVRVFLEETGENSKLLSPCLCLRRNSTSTLKAAREESASRRN